MGDGGVFVALRYPVEIIGPGLVIDRRLVLRFKIGEQLQNRVVDAPGAPAAPEDEDAETDVPLLSPSCPHALRIGLPVWTISPRLEIPGGLREADEDGLCPPARGVGSPGPERRSARGESRGRPRRDQPGPRVRR